MKKIGILTGGGDAPGLNAVIRAVVRKAANNGVSVVGFLEGWKGIIEGNTEMLDPRITDGVVGEGGTILGSSRTNPFKDPTKVKNILDNFARFELDAFIAVGGDDTLGAANKLYKGHGFKVVGVPKTIDNDLSATDYTFGFDTAVNRAMEALDNLTSTAKAHRRVMVVEIMGRHAGWIAAASGIAGGADVTLVPERPFSIDDIVATIKRNRARGKLYNLVAVAEGATLKAGDNFTASAEKDDFGNVKLGGIAPALAKEIEKRTGFEARHVVLGHLQRGGPPSAFDRILGTRLGLAACDLALKGDFGKMVALRGTKIVAVSLEEGVGQMKKLTDDYFAVLDEFDK
ncbi:MAG: ATP-dependent 6-phosphofructokinase [Candidatus Brocadiia bacterium]